MERRDRKWFEINNRVRTLSFRPKAILKYSERGTRLAMSKTIYTPDTSSLKPGLGAIEGVMD